MLQPRVLRTVVTLHLKTPEKKTETTIIGHIGVIGILLELYRDNGT